MPLVSAAGVLISVMRLAPVRLKSPPVDEKLNVAPAPGAVSELKIKFDDTAPFWLT